MPDGVEVAHLLLDAALGPGGLRAGLLQDPLQDGAVPVGQLVEGALAALVGRDRVGLQPAAVGELVEVIAGLHGRVERGRVDRLQGRGVTEQSGPTVPPPRRRGTG